MSAITAKASRKMKKYAVLTREPRCFLGSFDFSWEQRKLGDIGKARSGVGFPDADQGGVTGVPFFKVSDMNLDGNENEMIVANNYVTAEQIADHRWSPITELPAIFFAKVGAAVMLNRKRLCRFPFLLDNNTMAYSLSPTKWDADFAKALFGTVDLTSLVQVGALPSYNAGDVESMGIYLPSLFEQEQIGAFFKLLDNLITLHQRKCALLFSPFQAFISMMFTTSTFSWEQRKLGELVDRVVRKNTNNESTLPLTISAQYGLVDQITYFNNRVASRDVSNYYLVLNGEFAYNKSTSDGYPFGAVKRLDLYEKGVLSTLYIVFTPKNEQQIDSDFLTVFFDTDRWHKGVAERAAEGARNHGLLNISAEDFFDIVLSVPKDVAEQKQIGAFIRQLNHLITLHQRKCIFFTGRAGRLISTVNKKRITSSWEQRKLGDVVQITMGQSPDGSTYSDEPSDYILVQGNADLQNGWVCPRIWTTQITKKADAGDLIMSVRAPAGAMGKTAYNAVIGRGVAAIKGNEFIYQLLVKMDTDGFWKTLSCGSTFESLNSDNIKNAEVKIPTTAEQKKIGGLFQYLDNLITLHQRKPFLMKWRTSDANRNQTNRLVL